MTGDQMRLSGIGVVLFLGALILSHLLNYPYEMEPLYDQDKKLRLTLRGIALPDLQSKNATFVNLILRNDSDKPYGGDISELDFLLRRSSLVLTDGTGKTHKLVGLPWRFPYQDEPLPPKTERATWFIFDGVYEGIDTLQISGLPWQFPLVTLKAQLPSFLYAFDYNPWLLPLVVVAGGFAILVSAWKVASVRRFLIAILGMQAAFACLYATTVGIVPLVAGIAGTLILAAIVAAFGSHRLPLAYPASFAFAGYLIVTLGLVFWCYLAWLLFVQDAGFLSDYLLLFLSTALALYAAPSAGSFRIVAAVLGAPLIFVLIRDLGVAPEALRVDAEGGLVNLLGRMKLYSGLFCFFSVFILLYLVGQTRRTH